MARSLRDHRYNVSPKGVARQRRYDRSLRARVMRRERDLNKARDKALTSLDEVRKELESIG